MHIAYAFSAAEKWSDCLSGNKVFTRVLRWFDMQKAAADGA